MPVLVTRMYGKRVALNQIDSGVGPRLWVAEFRDAANRPIATHDQPGERYRHVVIAGPSIGQVLSGLTRLDRGRR